jgi:hypothetical protein
MLFVSERGRRQRPISAIRAERASASGAINFGSRAADRRRSEETCFSSPSEGDVSGLPARSARSERQRAEKSKWPEVRQPGSYRLAIALIFISVAPQQHRLLVPPDERSRYRPQRHGV